MSRLALGTAQFGLDYGINNPRGKIPAAEAGRIIALAAQSGVDTIDTAYAYGDSESVLGGIAAAKPFRIVSKLPDSAKEPGRSPEYFLKKTLERLGVKSVYGYLLHNPADMETRPEIPAFLENARRNGLVEKAGCSFYYPEEVRRALSKNLPCDIVQVPYSVFDRRFEPLLPELRKRGVEIHVRSVFLQGLFFRDLKTLPAYFSGVAGKLSELRRIADANGLELSALCLGFALANENVDRVVCGVDSAENMKDNLLAESRAAELPPGLDALRVDDENMLVPSRWRTA